MKATIENYFDVYSGLPVDKLPAEFIKMNEKINQFTRNGQSWETYKSNETIKRVTDLYFDKLNAWIETHKPKTEDITTEARQEPEQKTKDKSTKAKVKSTKSKRSGDPAHAGPKAPKAAKAVDHGNVEHVEIAVALIKRYVKLEGKNVERKTIAALLKSVQNAIATKHIGKTHKYGSEILHIQDELTRCLKEPDKKFNIKLKPDSREKYIEIAKSETVMTSVNLIKKFISLIDLKKGEYLTSRSTKTAKQNAEMLLTKVEKVPAGDKYISHINKIKKYLTDFIESKTEKVKIDEYALNGFLGACGMNGKRKRFDPNNDEFYLLALKWRGFDDMVYRNSVEYRIESAAIKAAKESFIKFNVHDWENMSDEVSKKEINQKNIAESEIIIEWYPEGYESNYEGIESVYGKDVLKKSQKSERSGYPAHAGPKPSRHYLKKKSKAVNGLSGPNLEPDEIIIEEELQAMEPEQPSAKDQRPKAKSPGVINSRDMSNRNFELLPVTDVWSDILGKPCRPFFMMLFGMPGSGKSTMAILFAKYLAKDQNMKVLYVASEEGFSYTLKEKFERIGAYDDNIDLATEMPKDISQWDVIFTDSVNDLKLSVDDVANLIKRGKETDVSFVFIYQATKQGLYKGMSENEHLVDVSINIENGVTRTIKNRFGGNGRMNVFDHVK